MAKYVIEDTTLNNTANAIREKTGKTDKITPSNFATEIASIENSSGGDTTNEDTLITRIGLSNYSNARVTSIGNYAFYYVDLENVYLPNVITVGEKAFSYTTRTSGQVGLSFIMDLPKATTLKNKAFSYSASSLTQGYYKCNLPEALSLGKNCFEYSIGIKQINPKDETADKFLYAPKLDSIGDECFYNCMYLTYADLKNITNIGSYAFSGTKLKTLILRGETVCILSGSLGSGITIAKGTGYIYVPDALVDSYKSATNWSTYADQIKPISELEASV